MSKISLFGKQIDMLSYSMDIRSRIHDTISSNIANVNTPGYKCKNLDFQKEFNKIISKEEQIELTTTNSKHIKINPENKEFSNGNSEACSNTIIGNDKNNVDMDKEMAKLSKNQVLYNIDSQILVKEFKILKDVIMQGGK